MLLRSRSLEKYQCATPAFRVIGTSACAMPAKTNPTAATPAAKICFSFLRNSCPWLISNGEE